MWHRLKHGHDEDSERRELRQKVFLPCIAFHLLLYLITLYCHRWLPDLPATVPDDAFDPYKSYKYLTDLTSMGVRTVGSVANDVVVPRYLLKELKLANATNRGDKALIYVSVQRPSGAFHTSFLGGFVNTYDSVPNVLLKVVPEGVDPEGSALLVNAHYDSALGTRGASDDAVNVAVMMEVVRIIRKHTVKLPVIFSFNGAEETNWQAAHGFITQHPWAHQVRAILNLECTGSGGREVVIQAGPGNPWLMDLYMSSVPYPHVHGLAQLIFQSGVLPGQTDFQTFRDNHPTIPVLPGLDLAVVAGGHVYHTWQDDLEHVSMQHLHRVGSNVLALVRAITAHPRMTGKLDEKEDGGMAFDMLGVVRIRLAGLPARLLNVAAVVLSCLAIRHLTKPHGVRPVLAVVRQVVLPAVGLGVMTAVGLAVVVTLLGGALSWYSSPWLLHMMYGCGAAAGILTWHTRPFAHPPSELTVFLAAETVWVTLAVPFALAGHTLVSYLVLVWTLPLFARALFPRLPPLPHLILSTSPPLIVWWHSYIVLVDFFAPFMERAGYHIYPDIFVAFLMSLLIGLTLLVPMALAHIPSKSDLHAVVLLLRGVALVGVAIAIFSFPFTRERPKRLYVVDMERQWLGNKSEVIRADAGMLLLAPDTFHIDTFKNRWPTLDKGNWKTPPCGTVYCDIPWYFPMKDLIEVSWLPAPRVKSFPMTVTTDSVRRGNGRRVTVTVNTACRQLTAVVNQGPRDGKVKAWSLTDRLPPLRKDCNCHWVFHSSGIANDTLRAKPPRAVNPARGYSYHPAPGNVRWTFTLDITGPPVNIAIYGHELDEGYSHDMQNLLDSAPDWVTWIAWRSAWRGLSV